MMNVSGHGRRGLVRAGVIAFAMNLVVTPLLWAQPPANSAKPGASAKAFDPALLAGPRVEDEAQMRDVPRLRAGDEMRLGDDMPFPMWLGALRGLELTPEQLVQIRPIAREYEQAARDYRDSLPAADRDVMRQARQARDSGQMIPRDKREKVLKIEANAPRPQPYQERIWALLTPEQQDKMKVKLDKARADFRKNAMGPNVANRTDDTMTDRPMGLPDSTSPATQPTDSSSGPMSPMNPVAPERPTSKPHEQNH